MTVNMMSRTHGQPAVTTSGKEMKVFFSRLQRQVKKWWITNGQLNLVVPLET